MKMWIKAFILLTLIPLSASAAGRRDTRDLKRVFFNLYTDSIKTVLNYYVNVEGEFRDGSYLPMDTSYVTISADQGTMSGNEWIAPKDIHFEKVVFTVKVRNREDLRDTITVWLKRFKDPRDAPDYEDMELPYPGSERKRR